MDKKELKRILKPLMKECVRELLMEEGMLKVISESVEPISESRRAIIEQRESQQIESMNKTYPAGALLQDPQETKRKIEENRKRMLDEIGRSGYLNGVNPFEGTQPLSEGQSPERPPGKVSERQKMPPSMNSVDPSDPGINIKGIINLAAGKWKTHLGGKG